MTNILDRIKEANPDETFLVATGFEDCVVGVEIETRVLIIDAQQVVDKLVKEDGMTRQDAIEYFYYNVSGSKGETYPIYTHIEPLS